MSGAGAALGGSAGTAAPARPSLLRLIGAELRKLVDTRAGLWLLVTVAVATIGVVATAIGVADAGETNLADLFGLSMIPAAVLLPVLGILSVTSEWSQRTALTTFALVPLRHRVAVAKIGAGVVAAVAAVATGLVTAALGMLVAEAFGSTAGWSLPSYAIPHAVLLQGLSVLMGLGFGMLLLNSPLAIVMYFVLPTVWSVLGGLIRRLDAVSQWLDTSRTMEPLMAEQLSGGDWARLGVSALAWIGVPLAVGLVRMLRHEVA
jgi:hypothetical protein